MTTAPTDADDTGDCLCDEPDCLTCRADTPTGSCDQCGCDLFADDGPCGLCGECQGWLSQEE